MIQLQHMKNFSPCFKKVCVLCLHYNPTELLPHSLERHELLIASMHYARSSDVVYKKFLLC